ncbi:MAG TPA: hypothetical protein VMR52_00560 [Dehalococcoidia bacterium]|nr:hypothetical protein [Dehalococcoidia bacterium]
MNSDIVLNRLRRVVTLDSSVFVEIRDDREFTAASAACALIGVLLAALGAVLYAETVLDFRPAGWIVDTLILGSLFTALLFAAAGTLIYVVLVQVYGINVAPEGLARVLGVAFGFYALGFFVFLPEVGFAAGLMSVALTFYYAVAAVRAIVPERNEIAVVAAVTSGFTLWIALMALLSNPPDNHFYTGVFVYSIFD